MMEINTNNEDDELPMPRNKKGGKMLPPASKDKLISTGSRMNKIRRKHNLDEAQSSQDEQIYNKTKISEEDEIPKPRRIQVEFMRPNGNGFYQTVLEFHRIYTILYFIIEELLFVYKCNYFDFPDYAAGTEITSLIFYLFIQLGRIHFGSLGNRSEASMFIILSIIYSVGAIYTYVEYCFMQTYVLRIELITNGIGAFLWLFEILFGLLAFIGISGKESGI